MHRSTFFDGFLAADFDLGDMPYAKGACFDLDKGCLPGTHENIIEEIAQWVNSPNADTMPQIFFLGGVAGYRKSHTQWHDNSTHWDNLGRHIASTAQTNCHPASLLSTITLDFADLTSGYPIDRF